MKESVAAIFVVTCRVLLLQLLRSSKAGIAARLDPRFFESHAMLFELMVNSQLAQVDYLLSLRDKLRHASCRTDWRRESSGHGMARLCERAHQGAGTHQTQCDPPGRPAGRSCQGRQRILRP